MKAHYQRQTYLYKGFKAECPNHYEPMSVETSIWLTKRAESLRIHCYECEFTASHKRDMERHEGETSHSAVTETEE